MIAICWYAYVYNHVCVLLVSILPSLNFFTSSKVFNHVSQQFISNWEITAFYTFIKVLLWKRLFPSFVLFRQVILTPSPIKVAFVCKQRKATWRTRGTWEVSLSYSANRNQDSWIRLHYPQGICWKLNGWTFPLTSIYIYGYCVYNKVSKLEVFVFVVRARQNVPAV